jgi:hypothetical protein
MFRSAISMKATLPMRLCFHNRRTAQALNNVHESGTRESE